MGASSVMSPVSARRSPIRVGIAGVGWGTVVHAPAFRLVDGYELVAICARRPESLTKAQDKLGITDGSTDWRSFVRRDDLDLISIATPVTLHSEVTLAAIAAGKHVLCEKPTALTPDAARGMAEAAERAGVAHAVGFELRWNPERLATWDLMRERALGDPYILRLNQSWGHWHPSHAPQEAWMYRKAEGGGYLNGLVSHDIDFARALMGEPVAVCADVRTSVKQRTLSDGRVIDVDADDTSTLLLRFASGACGVLSSSVVGVHAKGYRLEIFGSDGTLQAAGGRGAEVDLRFGRASDAGLAPHPLSERMPRSGRPIPARSAAWAIRSLALMLEDWLPAFDGQPTPVPNLRDGYRVQQLIQAALDSAAGRGWVDITP
jgi:predicted dehydrogenase